MEGSGDNYTYPIISNSDGSKLTYIGDLILGSFREYKITTEYFSKGNGQPAKCNGSWGTTVTIKTDTTILSLRTKECSGTALRMCLYDKNGQVVGGNCTDSYYGHTYYPLTKKPKGYRYGADGHFFGCALNPITIDVTKITSILFPAQIQSAVPIGTCDFPLSISTNNTGYSIFNSVLSAHDADYRKLKPKCVVIATKKASVIINYHGTIEKKDLAIIPIKVGCR